MNKATNTQYDYIIVGQGLAGSLLSYELIKKEQKCIVINKIDPQAASYIAGGIFSPIAGQRIAKIWQADEIVPLLPQFYRNLERALNRSFFHPKPYIKLLINEQLKKYAQKRFEEKSYKKYIKPIKYQLNNKKIDAIEIQQTGWVDTTTLLDRYRNYLKKQHAYLEDWFDDSQLAFEKDKIYYKNIQAKRVIFCNGLQATHNRFFSAEKMNPTKGELLTIKMRKDISSIISGNVFLLPIGNSLYHVGATFERNFKDTLPTKKGKEWLCAELETIIDTSYEIIDHKAGVRPTTFGHKPITYWHATYKNVGIFTGFGAKGVSYIPYCSKEFSKTVTS